MNGHGKSDNPKVPTRPPNKAEAMAAEVAEGSGLAKGNLRQQNAPRTLGREGVHSALERIRQAARWDKKLRFTALLHHVYNPDTLRQAYWGLNPKAAAGVDGRMWQEYGQDLDGNIQDLSHRLQRGGYRAKPVRRVYILKTDGRQRPLGVTTLEDKIVQRSMVEVLNAIYETDFLGFSYGFRPERNQHQALDALFVGLMTRKVNWVLDADIRGFFDSISREWAVKFVEHRVADKRVVRLIEKWWNAGVMEEGRRMWSEKGTVQGSSVSPLLANIYLHYVLDLWAHWWRRKQAKGDVIVVRWADDFIVGFEHREEAERFLTELRERMVRFGLALHPEKTRLIEFGRYAAQNRKRRAEGKPETFNFLGLTHCCGKTRRGRFTVLRRTMRKRLHAKVVEIRQELKKRMHDAIPEVGKWLRSVVVGHCRYYGVAGNSYNLGTFRYKIEQLWHRTLRRRSQKGWVPWERMRRLIHRWLPYARVYHPYPQWRLGVTT